MLTRGARRALALATDPAAAAADGAPAMTALLWVAAAAATGFGVTELCADRLRLPRSRFVLAHAAVTSGLVSA